MVEGLALVAVVILGLIVGLVVCRPKTTLPQTDPKGWSQGGWRDFKWGMGPGDVEFVLGEAKGDVEASRIQGFPKFDVDQSNADVRWLELPSALVLVGRSCTIRLGFYKNGLYHVGLEARFPGTSGEDNKATKEWRAKERIAWRDKVAALLREKYGAPTKVESDPEWWTAKWSLEPTTIELSAVDAFLADTGERSVEVYYQDTARSKLVVDGDPADKQKL